MDRKNSGRCSTRATGKALSRREFLKLGGVGLAGVALLGTATPALADTQTSAPDLGISKNNTATQNREALLKALTNSKRSVVFPPGDYFVDNSGPYIVIRNFGGQLTMEPGARFVFTDSTTRGLMFERGTGARFYGVRTDFSEPPQERFTSQVCMLFIWTTDTVVEDVGIQGSAGAGLLFGRCVRPSVGTATIKNTMGDGLHFANCQDARANDVLTEDTGDDGLAFLNYGGDMPDYAGGYATNITVKRSQARGITVIGQRDVTIDGFTVDETDGSGLHCAYEEVYGTRVPRNVTFRNGSVYRGGAMVGTPDSPLKSGIYISRLESVEFSNIKVVSPAARGVTSLPSDGTVRLSNIEVSDAPDSGFSLQKGTYYLDNLTANNSGRTGMHIADNRLVEYGRMQAINSSSKDPLRRAYSFERNARVEGTELVVVDSRKKPTGYKINASGEQAGMLGTVYDRVAKAKVQVSNASRLAYKGPVSQ